MVEYQIIDERLDGNPDNVFELNALGREGWELCGITETLHGAHRWFFKRSPQPNVSADMLKFCPNCKDKLEVAEACLHCGYSRDY